MLKRFGVETSYYDPGIGAGIRDLIRPRHRLVFTESPGSLTFEVQDIRPSPRRRTAWGPWSSRTTHGSLASTSSPTIRVDVSIQSATKYIVGHSDVMMGTITATEALRQPIQAAFNDSAVPPVRRCYLALRRPAHNDDPPRAPPQKRAFARRMAPKPAEVLSPASGVARLSWPRPVEAATFPAAPDLFAFRLKPVDRPALAAMLDHLELRHGLQLGRYESLLIPTDPRPIRTAKPWTTPGQMMRIPRRPGAPRRPDRRPRSRLRRLAAAEG